MNGANGFFLVSSAPHPTADRPGTESDSRTFEIRSFDIDEFHDAFFLSPIFVSAARRAWRYVVATR